MGFESTYDEVNGGSTNIVDWLAKQVIYTKDEQQYLGFLLEQIFKAYTQRANTYVELDDMDYLTWYDTNAKAGNAYLRRKLNEEDTRIVTGTTLEKTGTLLSSMLGYNFVSSINAYDKEGFEIPKLGMNFEELVRRSREIEGFDEKKLLIYKEFMDQGTIFIEEEFNEFMEVEKRLNKSKINFQKDFKNISKIEWTRRIKKVMGRAQANLLDGRKVYLGNIREFFIEKQPYIVTSEVKPYNYYRALFGNWERWEYVPRKRVKFHPMSEDDNSTGYQNWAVTEEQVDLVERVNYYDPWNNEMQIMLNGVMMMPIKFPLSAVSPSGGYPLVKGDLWPINFQFAYSKSIPSKTKVDQAVLDEFLRLMILKTQQSFRPPMANSSGRTLSQNIFRPGKITNDLDVEELQPIIKAGGVTSSEFNMYRFVKELVDQKSTSEIMSGNSLPGRQTAREIMELKRGSMLKMGYAVAGVMNLHKGLDRLRLHNILENYTRANDASIDLTRNMMVDTVIEDGRKGKRIIRFADDVPSEDQVEAEEDLMSESSDKPVRITYIRRSIRRLPLFFEFKVRAEQEQVEEMERLLFTENIMQGLQMFGPQSFNMDYVKQQWAIKNNMDPDKLLVSGLPQMTGLMGQEMASPNGGTVGQQLQGGMAAQVRSPLVNSNL